MDLHPDFKDLLVEFDRFGVRYALLGGYAVGYHSKPRAPRKGLRTSQPSRCWNASEVN